MILLVMKIHLVNFKYFVALEEGVWGQLYPHCGAFPRIPLSKDVFRFGRASSCDYVIRYQVYLNISLGNKFESTFCVLTES